MLQGKEDQFSKNLSQVYKLLFRQRIEMIFSKARVANFDVTAMKPHFARFTRLVYDMIVAQLRTEIAMKFVSEAKANADERQAEIDAEKSMSLTKMKETKFAYEGKLKAEKDARIIEYIKYLIGQTKNNEFVLRP